MGRLMLNPEFQLYERSGNAFCSSRQVAETFGKEHRNVLQTIREAIEITSSLAANFSAANFIETQYKDRGKFYPEFLLTKDGFSYVAMGFTGKKAAAFKIAYIKRFNDMEAFIKSMLAARFEFPAFSNAVMQAHEEPKFYHYSNELNMINRVVLGVDSKQYKKLHSIPEDEKSIRPYLSVEEAAAIEALQRADIGLLMVVPEFNRRKEFLTGLYQKLKHEQTLQGISRLSPA